MPYLRWQATEGFAPLTWVPGSSALAGNQTRRGWWSDLLYWIVLMRHSDGNSQVTTGQPEFHILGKPGNYLCWTVTAKDSCTGLPSVDFRNPDIVPVPVAPL